MGIGNGQNKEQSWSNDFPKELLVVFLACRFGFFLEIKKETEKGIGLRRKFVLQIIYCLAFEKDSVL